jgi:hypothetical protein
MAGLLAYRLSPDLTFPVSQWHKKSDKRLTVAGAATDYAVFPFHLRYEEPSRGVILNEKFYNVKTNDKDGCILQPAITRGALIN